MIGFKSIHISTENKEKSEKYSIKSIKMIEYGTSMEEIKMLRAFKVTHTEHLKFHWLLSNFIKWNIRKKKESAEGKYA